MIILPAIDLKDSKCVRLYRGDFATTHQVADDPVAVAGDFVRSGAKYIHMVDLDGALDGVRKNSGLIQSVIRESGLKIELGGGIRSMDDLERAFDIGIFRAVIGSAAVTDPAFVEKAAAKYGRRVAVGIDAAGGRVKTAGWTEDSGVDYLELSRRMEGIGVQVIIFTDIETDGTMEGPAFNRLKVLKSCVHCDIVASGGVGCIQDIERLRDMGLYGAIVGKAYYEGAVNLTEAVERAGAQCWPNE